MYAEFKYAKIYQSDDYEIIMKPQDKRNDRVRRFAVCSNANDAQAIVVALNAMYSL